ncbi:hypothetical protein OAG1_42080 [Agarivorans sp. OAG1]|uniref:hypothetical protein n=1 Tax=Agarivorans sp. OAG1 TaxID=3082387 RepID=UPI002B2AFCE7|nr:hypothetical protein OAG1_42080 [Agarivorans sp. OAG1]
MKYMLTIACSALSFVALASSGTISEPITGLIFSYNEQEASQVHYDLSQCQAAAQSSQQQTTDKRGSGARGAAKGALAGAAVGAISGGSGSDGAKVGAAAGVVGGRLSARKQSKDIEEKNAQNLQTVMRNCMQNQGYTALN